MNRTGLKIALLAVFLLAATSVYAQVRFSDFEVTPRDGQVIVSWKTSQEAGALDFVIERSVDGVQFFDIATFPPQGANKTYRYIDTDLFKQSSKTFHYRVRCDDVSGGVHRTMVRTVTVSISNIQQTWGSLKAMFR